MTGSNVLSLMPDALFPGPAKDQWYRRFLWLPFVTQIDYDAKRTKLARPWPVTVYVPDGAEAMQELANTSIRLSPLATDLGSLTNPPPSPDLLDIFPWATFQMTAATPIILETPLLFASAPADSDQWNHGILAGDISDRIDSIDLVSGDPAGTVDLRNVFLEFSLLERAGWERVERSKSDLVRALWLMRNQDQLVAHLVLLSFPEQQHRIVGPVLFKLDDTGRRLQWWSRRGWAEITGLELVSKPLFVALTILRAVSTSVKADPFPMMVTKTSEGLYIFVEVRGQAAKLVRIDEPGQSVWYAVKEANSDAPFFFDEKSSMGQLEFKDSAPWSQLDPRLIRNALP